MDISEEIKKFNQLIPAELKIKFKELATKLNGLPPAAPVIAAAPAAPVAPAATFGEGLLEDGKTVIKYNTPTLAEGSIVTVVTPEGELPAPEGEHKLQDGSVITVSVKEGASVVTAYQPAAPAEPVMQAAPAAIPQLQAQVAGFSEQLKTFLTEKKELTDKFEAQGKVIEAQTKQIEELKGIVKDFVEVFSSIADIPSGEPTEGPVNKYQKAVSEKANKLSKLSIN